jgi:hypothetical protein
VKDHEEHQGLRHHPPPPPAGTGKTLVRTKPPSVRWYEETEGYTITVGWLNWKAARAIAAMYAKAASS